MDVILKWSSTMSQQLSTKNPFLTMHSHILHSKNWEHFQTFSTVTQARFSTWGNGQLPWQLPWMADFIAFMTKWLALLTASHNIHPLLNMNNSFGKAYKTRSILLTTFHCMVRTAQTSHWDIISALWLFISLYLDAYVYLYIYKHIYIYLWFCLEVFQELHNMPREDCYWHQLK